MAWDFELTRETKIYATETFASDEAAAAAGFRQVEEIDGKTRHYMTRLEPLELTDEECAALSEARARSQGAAVGPAAGRFLTVFGIVFLIAYAIGGILLGAQRRSWLLFLQVSVPGCIGGLMMYWVGRLIGEVLNLRGMILRKNR
ncbi:MAG: hypothetical protein CVU59_08815 [Deltaproteobacteria bacterium HGW-Deltaproteobacteria-17]|nr:MAG: hypothetical protein CVU59_08815 [Deltaproteobacteria bacterium HGW-Deltaproteobacteria-17]